MLTLKNIRKSHGGGRGVPAFEVLQDINLTVAEGEFVCVLGPSGCGKTTLLNIIAGFEQPSNGEVLLNREKVKTAGRDSVVLFQDANAALFPWLTAAENVEFGLRMNGIGQPERSRLTAHFLTMVGLSEHADKFPHQLSGGMRQRVQIARGLAIDPKILLADEPFGALDAQARHRMQLELLQIWEATRKTVIFVTHDIIESITLADKVVIMTPGPGSTITEVIQIRLPRPRDPGSADFAFIHGAIERRLYQESDAYLMFSAPVKLPSSVRGHVK